MDSWRRSLNLTSTLSAVGLTVYGLSAVALGHGMDNPTASLPSSSDNDRGYTPSHDDSRSCLSQQDLNTCAPNQPMRALSPEEVQIVMGTNYLTDSRPGTSHGGCSDAGCHVTASPPPSSGGSFPPSSPPPDSPPPDNGGGGGDSGGPNQYPATAALQTHLENCAKVYGTTRPNPNYTTNFTQEYGFQSLSKTTGLVLQNAVEPTDNPPTTVPQGGTPWGIIGGATHWSSPPYKTDLYMYAYPRNSTAYTVNVISHEWYHQNHDVPGESDKQRGDNETAAKAAGAAAQAAYEKDNGAKCAGM
ncbi:hypothetical protein [Dyella sp.]|uniref:hypothetical protein n=1 Tax=Dyella sp. TaxID=1869338 RepID=UPI003F807847